MDRIHNTLGEDHPGVEVLDEREVAAVFALAERGWSINAMVKELGWSRNTIRTWLRQGPEIVQPTVGRPKKLAEHEGWLAEEFQPGTRNGDVLRQELAKKGLTPPFPGRTSFY